MDGARPAVHRLLVSRARLQDPAQDHPGGAVGQGRLLSRTVFAVALVAATTLACGPSPPPTERVGGIDASEATSRHLVLVTVDTWRGDHALVDLAGVELTPRLAALARHAVVFEQASSVATATTAGVAGILTGLWPHRSGVVNNESLVPAAVPTLATRLDAAGFTTAAIVSSRVIGDDNGFERGFDDYRLLPWDPPWVKPEAQTVTDAALDWLQSAPRDERIFLWVHYMDPHGPYTPSADERALFTPTAFGDPAPVALLEPGDDRGRGGVPHYQHRWLDDPSTDAREYLASYAAEVRAFDAELGRLVDGLDAGGWLDAAVLVVTSDHGEALAGDHGFFFSHGHGLTEDQLHVPLLLMAPGVPAGATVELPVSTADILPTVLGRLGVGLDGPDIDGVDLLTGGPRDVVAQNLNGTSLRRGDRKLVWDARGARLYDLAVDPGESVDLAASAPEELGRVRREIAKIKLRPALADPEEREAPDDEERIALEALGYL